MKMASLDGLKGYAQDHYGEVKQQTTTDYVSQSLAGGYQVLREPLWNKGVHLLSPDPKRFLPNSTCQCGQCGPYNQLTSLP